MELHHPISSESDPARIRSALRAAFLAHQDEDYRNFQGPLLATVKMETMIGVRTPILRRMARELRKIPDMAAVFLQDLPHVWFEENQFHAFLIGCEPDCGTALRLTDAFLPFVNNWATCDQLVPCAFRGHFREVLPYADRWMQAEPEFTVRFGIRMLMDYGLGEDFDPSFPERVAAIQRENYYIRTMKAWYFATALGPRYEEVLPYLRDRRLDPTVHRMTIRKAVESFCVTDEHKAVLRTFRD